MQLPSPEPRRWNVQLASCALRLRTLEADYTLATTGVSACAHRRFRLANTYLAAQSHRFFFATAFCAGSGVPFAKTTHQYGVRPFANV